MALRLPTRPVPHPFLHPLRDRGARGTGAVAATLALLAFGANMASPLYPGYQAAFGFGDLTLTAIYAIYAVVSVPALLVLGPAGDRLGARALLRAGLVLGAVGSLCFALADGPTWLVVGRVAHGLALGAATGAGMVALVAHAAPGRRARASTQGGLAFVAGTAAGPALTGLVTQYTGAYTSSFVLHLVALAVVGVRLRALPATASRPQPSTGPAALWTRPHVPAGSRRTFAAAAATGAVSWTVVGLFLGLVPTVVTRDTGTTDLALIGAVVAVVLGAALPAELAVPRLGARRAQRTGLALLAGSLGILALTGAAAGLALTMTAAVLGGLGHGLAYGGAHDAVQAAGDLDPARAAGLNAAAYVVFFLGAGVPSVAVGLLTLAMPLATAIAALAKVALLAAAVAGALRADAARGPVASSHRIPTSVTPAAHRRGGWWRVMIATGKTSGTTVPPSRPASAERMR